MQFDLIEIYINIYTSVFLIFFLFSSCLFFPCLFFVRCLLIFFFHTRYYPSFCYIIKNQFHVLSTVFLKVSRVAAPDADRALHNLLIQFLKNVFIFLIYFLKIICRFHGQKMTKGEFLLVITLY